MSELIKNLEDLKNSVNKTLVEFPIHLNELPTLMPMAHPIHFGNGTMVPGMTLWDYFFTNAVNAILSGYSVVSHNDNAEEICEKAAEYADIMIELRQKNIQAEVDRLEDQQNADPSSPPTPYPIK
jgi:CTP:phosphocholine cytidylyltransferase-like protein